MKEILVYKPRVAGGGTALRMNVRAATDDDKGGLFIEFAKQQGVVEKGSYPTFAWGPDAEGKVVGKLGLPDILGMLEAHAQLRHIQGVLAFDKRALPASMQPKGSKSQAPQHTVEFFHKSGGGSLIISWQVNADGSFLGASRASGAGTPLRASISLTLPEERLLVRYLERSLDVFISAGMR